MFFMNIASFNWLDFVIIATVFFSVLISLARGFIKEAISLVGWIVAIWASMTYADDLNKFLSQYNSSPNVTFSVSFAIIFLVTLIVFSVINFAVSHIIKVSGLGKTDKFLGIVFGFSRGILVVAIFILIGEVLSLSKSDWWMNSVIIGYIKPLANWLEKLIPMDLHTKLMSPPPPPGPGA
jgi:membrane protein required for colicin V production